MNIPSLSDLKAKIVDKVTEKVTEKIIDNFGGNPLGKHFSSVTKLMSDFDLEKFKKLSTEEQVTKGLLLGGAAMGTVGLLGLIGKSSGVDFLSSFSEKTFPIILGLGAAALIGGLAIPMYEKYKQNEAGKQLGAEKQPAGSIQLLDSNGVVIKEANAATVMNSGKLNPDFISSKIQTLDSKFSELDKPKFSSLPVPRPA